MMDTRSFPMHPIRVARIAGMALAALAVATPGLAAERQAFLGIRLLKTEGAGPVAWSLKMPAGCGACRLVVNGNTASENAKELFFHLWVPRDARGTGTFRMKLDPARIRGVLASYTDLDLAKNGYQRPEARANGIAVIPFRRVEDGIAFEVPAEPKGVDMPPDDLQDVAQNYTYIETPGVYIRIGHADEQRRRGAYVAGRWPAVEARAAINLAFAGREAVQTLQLEKTLAAKGVATIMLMNFDTNYPTLGPDKAHEDWPPHWHMHLFWADAPKVRKVGHFYISPDGRLGLDKSNDPKPGSLTERAYKWYATGERNETRTPSGDLVYAQTITADGDFRLDGPTGSCLLSPASSGFHDGVKVACEGAKAVQVRAEDDLAAGKITLFKDGKPAIVYSYDKDSGALLSTR